MRVAMAQITAGDDPSANLDNLARLVEEAAAAAESLEEQSRTLVRAVAMFRLDESGAASVGAQALVSDNVARLPERPARPVFSSNVSVVPKVRRASGAANEVDDEWEEF